MVAEPQMLAGDTFLGGSLALGLSRAVHALASGGLIGFVNPQIGLCLPFAMGWLRALQTGLWPVAPRPWQGGFSLLGTLACLDSHTQAGAR